MGNLEWECHVVHGLTEAVQEQKFSLQQLQLNFIISFMLFLVLCHPQKYTFISPWKQYTLEALSLEG